MKELSHEEILELLSHRPGEMLVSPDGTQLYIQRSDKDLLILIAEGENFKDMSDEQINDFVYNKLKEETKMEKHNPMSDEERELNNQLLKSLAIFLGLKVALYVFIAWSARWARKHSQ